MGLSGQCVAFLLAALSPCSLFAQGSQHALRFFGSGVAPPGQQDRVKIRIDGPASVLDVGSDFTIDFWLRASAANNTGTVTAQGNGDGWITGNVVIDRDIFGSGDNGDFGISIGGSGGTRVVAFGTDVGGSGLTIVGTNQVGDNAWRHIAVTRVRTSGEMRIYVDGRLDAQGTGPTGDISYRNGRSTSYPNSDPFLVFAAEKHDAGAAYPSLNGFLDEVRVWTQALSQAQISNVFDRVIATNTPSLIAYYRFEAGAGTNLTDSAGQSPTGLLIAGVPGNGEWVARLANTNNTAPVVPQTPPGPTTTIDLATVPAGLPLLVNGSAVSTPVTLTPEISASLTLAAPTNAVLAGTTYVFRCWSDGGAQSRSLVVPSNAVTLRAGFAPAPGGSLSVPVPSTNYNAESYAGTTAPNNAFDLNGLCVGRDGGGRYEQALAFPLSIPQGALIQSASLRVRSTSDQSGSPQITVRAFNVSNVAAYAFGAGSSVTGLHPLTSAAATWLPGAFVAGQTYTSPSLVSVVQDVVLRGDWSPGSHLGLVLVATNGSGDHWRCWNNARSGNPPVLDVAYATAGSSGEDLDGDGIPDDWEAANGLDCTSGGDGTQDGDGDTIINRAEYIAGTSPTNGASFQRLDISPPSVSNGWKLVVATVTGRVYEVEVSTNLLSPFWRPLATNLSGSGSPLLISDTNTAPNRYFRSGVRLGP